MNGLNRVDLIGNLGGNPDIRAMQSGSEVANFSVATNEVYKDRQTGEYKENTEWHRVVVYQEGLINMLKKHAEKGRLAHITGKLRTRKWKDRDGNERYTTEIVVGPRGSINFLDKRNGNGSTEAAATEAPPADAHDYADEIPF